MIRWQLSITSFALAVGMLRAPLLAAPPESEAFFETHVRPVLVTRCYKCHSADALSRDELKGGLRVDTRDGLRKGGDSGPAVVPGKPTDGTLLSALRYEDTEMPPDEPLSDTEIAVIEKWIRHGAVDPRKSDPREGQAGASAKKIDFAAGRKHWSYLPIASPQPPAVANETWAVDPLDQFVLARLEQAQLAPSPPADRRTWIRRVTFDLIGLPPTYEEVAAFVADKSPTAKQKVANRLLASPHYGERWARHWLDVARYADTRGYIGVGRETRYPYAYTYRDYVVAALNNDKPFDRFVLEQLAADQLEVSDDKSELAAMGFLTAGHRFMGRKQLAIDQTIDVVSRGLLGMSVTCARCHDHKYDAIEAADYYSLYGIFNSSTEPNRLPTIGKLEKTPEFLAYVAKRDELSAAIEAFDKQHKDHAKLNTAQRIERAKLRDALVAHELNAPGAPPRAMVLHDLPQAREPHIFIRGNAKQRGEKVPRRYLRVLSTKPQHEKFTNGSGRLELAREIASADNPLTARVIVNRIWQHHFGQGLVRTPSDFGTRGERPTHPKLLDHLASTFMADGWSLKRLHKRIVLSSTYGQASSDRDAAIMKDSTNRLLWRYSRRRLEFEPLRDAVLAVSGQLDRTFRGRSIDLKKQPQTGRRSLYLEVRRERVPTLLRTFDVANPNISTAARTRTTVPQQALFLMNSEFVLEQAKHLAARAGDNARGDTQWLESLYRWTLARDPFPAEMQVATAYLKNEPTAAGNNQLSARQKLALTLLETNEFMFVD